MLEKILTIKKIIFQGEACAVFLDEKGKNIILYLSNSEASEFIGLVNKPGIKFKMLLTEESDTDPPALEPTDLSELKKELETALCSNEENALFSLRAEAADKEIPGPDIECHPIGYSGECFCRTCMGIKNG